MDNRKQRYLQSFRRVQGWAVANDDLLRAAPPALATLVGKLGEVVARIEQGAAQQAAQHHFSTRRGTDAKVRRAEVRAAMHPIAQVGRTLQGTVYGISAISKMPDANLDNDQLAKAATSMAENASIFRDTLIENGLQPDCIEALQAAAAALQASVDARGLARSAAVGASNGLRADVSQGVRLVSLIDAGLQPLVRTDASKLASWRNAKRVTIKGVVGVIAPPASESNASSTPSVTTETHAA